MYLTDIKLNSLKAISMILLVMSMLISVANAQKNAERGGGSSPTPTPAPNPLPKTPPTPDILYRESFGGGPYLQRPSGGKGTMKSSYIYEKLGGFWIEYPGSKNTQWMNLDTSQGWRLCSTNYNDYELFSPLQVLWDGTPQLGCIASGFDEPTGISPTALMPISAPIVPYEVSFNGYPTYLNGKYLAVGLTNSSILSNNLESVGSVVLRIIHDNSQLNYEFRVGTSVLTSGTIEDQTWNRLNVRVDPVQHTIGGSINEIDLGTYPIDVGRPRYAGFEGIGIGDNFVIRKLQ